MLGHLREMVAASGVGARVSLGAVPVLAEAWGLVEQDCIPDGTRNNLNYLVDFVDWSPAVPAAARVLLCDAQTSGGLLIAVPRGRVEKLLRALRRAGIEPAAAIGTIVSEPKGRIRVVKGSRG